MTLTEHLKRLLACTYSLASQTHVAHWNVTGREFAALHKLFGNQYDDLYGYSDAIAEYIRSRDTNDFAPGGLTTLARLSSIREMASTGLTADKFLRGLVAGYDELLKHVAEAGKMANDEKDADTADFLNGLSRDLKKSRWMLVASF